MIGNKKNEYTTQLEIINNLQNIIFEQKQNIEQLNNDNNALKYNYDALLNASTNITAENKRLIEQNNKLKEQLQEKVSLLQELINGRKNIKLKELELHKEREKDILEKCDRLQSENERLRKLIGKQVEHSDEVNKMQLNEALNIINCHCVLDDSIYYKYESLLSVAKQLLIFYEDSTNKHENVKEINSMTFNKQAIIDLQTKINSKSSQPETEEATKQWFIMPLLVALGYDPYSSDIIPEYTLDVGMKKGEKVDYALQINNQPVALVECKQLSVQLSDKHISQLYRYFTVSDVHIAILTNGDEYWFFTDSQKENVMDLEPYYTIKLSTADTTELDKLEQYSKDLIQYVDMAQTVQYERFINECKELAHGLRINNIPSWLLETLADRSGLTDIDKPTLADYLYTEIQNEFNGYKVDKKDKKSTKTSEKTNSLGAKMKATMEESKKNISKIKLNHEYVYNDYSDGNWKFHTLDYAIILGVKYEGITGRTLLLNTVTELFKQNKINRDDILKQEQFNGTYKINAADGFRGAYYLEDYNVYVSTSYGIEDIIKFIERLLSYAGVRDEEVKISFKS